MSDNGVVRRDPICRISTILICVWLGCGPVISASLPWAGEHSCCCGGERACLLGGCECGEHGARKYSPCGGMRSADDTDGSALLLSVVRYLGVETLDRDRLMVEFDGLTLSARSSVVEPAASPPEPPPPRCASAR